MSKVMLNGIPYAGSLSDAEDVGYDNTISGLSATDVQGAIDELVQGGSSSELPHPVFMDGTRHFFGGSGTYLTLGSPQYTWFKPGAYALSIEIYYYALGTTDGYLFCIGNNASGNDLSISVKRVVTYWGQDWTFGDNNGFGLHHLVVTYNGDKTFQVYRDGTLLGTNSISSAINLQLSGMCFGSWIGSTSQECLKGSVFYTRAYDHVLTLDEVTELYKNRGK